MAAGTVGRGRRALILGALLVLVAATGSADDPVGGTRGPHGPAGAEPGRTPDGPPAQLNGDPAPAEDAHLEQMLASVRAAWNLYLEDDDDENRRAFQVKMADFLNDAVNTFPASEWTLEGVDLYCESRIRAAAEQARRFRNYARSARMLEAVRAYYEMIGVEPKPELVEAIRRYDARAAR